MNSNMASITRQQFMILTIVGLILVSSLHSIPLEEIRSTEDALKQNEDNALIRELCLHFLKEADVNLARKELKEYCELILVDNFISTNFYRHRRFLELEIGKPTDLKNQKNPGQLFKYGK